MLEKVVLKENGFQLESEFIIQAVKNGFTIDFIDIPTIYNSETSYISHFNDTFRFIRLFLRELF